MSFGEEGGPGNCADGGLRQAICNAVAAGVTFIAAAGNSTIDVAGFRPANFPEVITVSAMTDLTVSRVVAARLHDHLHLR